MKDNERRARAAIIFLDAASYIRQYGWQKEGMGDDSKPKYSEGALASSYSVQKWDYELSNLMFSELYKRLNNMTISNLNTYYNDRELVALLYEQVADSLAEKLA
jgi:hypothetical protein